MFYISPEELESLKKRWNERYMFQVLNVSSFNCWNLKFQSLRLQAPFEAPPPPLPHSQSQRQELLRTLHFSSSIPKLKLLDSLVKARPNKPLSSRTDPRGGVDTTPKGSNYPLSPSLSHSLQGSPPFSPQDCPARRVGGRISYFWRNWEANPWVLNVVKTGYTMKFWHPPPLSTIQSVQSGSSN